MLQSGFHVLIYIQASISFFFTLALCREASNLPAEPINERVMGTALLTPESVSVAYEHALVSSLAAHYPYSELDQSRKAGNLEALLHRCQLIGDLDMLGAFLKAGSATNAVACEMGIVHHSTRCCNVLVHSLIPAMREGCIVRGETHGNVHTLRTRHTIPASSAGDLVVLRYALAGLLHGFDLSIFEGTW